MSSRPARSRSRSRSRSPPSSSRRSGRSRSPPPDASSERRRDNHDGAPRRPSGRDDRPSVRHRDSRRSRSRSRSRSPPSSYRRDGRGGTGGENNNRMSSRPTHHSQHPSRSAAAVGDDADDRERDRAREWAVAQGVAGRDYTGPRRRQEDEEDGGGDGDDEELVDSAGRPRSRQAAERDRRKAELVSSLDPSSEEYLMAQMGLPVSFASTAGEEVECNQVQASRGASRVRSHRQYRQYMNRIGGFNRSLDKEATKDKAVEKIIKRQQAARKVWSNVTGR